MAAPERVQLGPAGPSELPLPLQRELYLIVEQHYDAGITDGGTALGEAVARFAFDHQLLYVPADAQRAREGLRFYPVTPQTVKPVWVVRPAPAPAAPPAPTRRPPSLHSLGAEPIER